MSDNLFETGWWAEFVPLHQEEWTEKEGGSLHITGWTYPDDPNVIARKVYSRSRSYYGRMTVTENTIIEIHR